MFLWQALEAVAPQLTGKQDEAWKWLDAHFPGIVNEFQWDAEREAFDRNLRALHWLATENRAVGSEAESLLKAAPKRIPRWVNIVLCEYIGGIRNRPTGEYVHELGIQPTATKADKCFVGDSLVRSDDLTAFWQVVFVQFIDPDFLSDFGRFGPVCNRCFKPLGLSPGGKTRRAELCPSCHVARWRENHPSESREIWREDKRKQRKNKRSTKKGQ